jgi:hypothetical protein
MVWLRWALRLVVILIAFVVVAGVAARYHDGPIGPLIGGPLASGPVVAAPVTDWSFAADVPEVELQLDAQDKSRTVWILVHDGHAYVPAATEYPPGKTWHRVALDDGRATLRIDGKRYPVTLRKTDDPTVLQGVFAVAAKKYPSRPGGPAWLFEVASRDPSAAS